jgi:hypothetical protein
MKSEGFGVVISFYEHIKNHMVTCMVSFWFGLWELTKAIIKINFWMFSWSQLVAKGP